MAILSIFVNTAMIHTNKVSLNYKSAWLLAALFSVLTVQSKDKVSFKNSFCNLLTCQADTTKKNKNKVRSPKKAQELKQEIPQPIDINAVDTPAVDTPKTLKVDTSGIDTSIAYTGRGG